MKGIYLVVPHARAIAEGDKTLIVSAKPAPREYMNKPIYFIQDNKIYGTLTLTDVKGPLPAKTVRETMYDKHRISEAEWESWAAKYPEWNRDVYVYTFKVDELFIPPKSTSVPQGVQKWIDDIEPKRLVTPKQVLYYLEHPDALDNIRFISLNDWHHIVHMWAGANWKSKPVDLTKQQIIRFHNAVVRALKAKRDDYKHTTALTSPYAPVNPSGQDTGVSITQDGVLEAWSKPIMLKSGYITVIGGVANRGESTNDIEVFVKDVEWNTAIHQPVLFRLGRALPPKWAEQLHMHFAGEYGGEFTSHFAVYDLVLVPSADRTVKHMQRLRDPEATRQANTSKRENSVKPLRFIIPAKPRKGYFRFANLVPSMVEQYFKGTRQLQVQKVYDGARCIWMKSDDRVIVRSDDGTDITDRFPTLVARLKTKGPKAITFDTEVEQWIKGEHQHREVTSGYLRETKTKADDSTLVANVFDIMYLEDKGVDVPDIHKIVYGPRYALLQGMMSLWGQSTNERPKTGLFNLTPSILVKSDEHDKLAKVVDTMTSAPASEGVIMKDADSEYVLTGRNNRWVKFKPLADIFIVIGRNIETKTPDVYNIEMGLPIPQGWNVPDDKKIDIDGKIYGFVGRSFNVKGRQPVGKTARVAFHTLFHHIGDDKQYVTLYEPYFEEVVVRSPDTLATAIRKAKDVELYEQKRLQSVWPMDDKPHSSVIQHHFRCEFDELVSDYLVPGTPEFEHALDDIIAGREPNKLMGRSMHADFRIAAYPAEPKLIGFTVFDQIPGAIKDDVDTLDKARAISANWDHYSKWTDKAGEEKKLQISYKSREPSDWLFDKIAIGDGRVVERGEVGATRFEFGVFLVVDRPTVYFGAQKAYYSELFLSGKRFTGRWNLRHLPFPYKKEVPREEFLFLFWKPEDQTPYVLTHSAITAKWIPPKGISCLPPEIRNSVSANFKYWDKEKLSERLQTRDELVRSLRIGETKLKGLEYHYLMMAEPPEISEPDSGTFVVQHHWWEAPTKPVRVGPSTEHWDVAIEIAKDKPLMHWTLRTNPVEGPADGSYENLDDHSHMDMPAEPTSLAPGTKWNPTKATPAWIKTLDRGNVTIQESRDTFVKCEFKGRQMQGTYLISRATVHENMWTVEKVERAP